MPINQLPTRAFDELWKLPQPKKIEGTHAGHLDFEARERRHRKNTRTTSHQPGEGQSQHEPCNSYTGCVHHKHGITNRDLLHGRKRRP